MCIFVYICICVCVQETGFLRVTAGEADVVFQDTPWAPAINDDNLNFDTLVFAKAAGPDELRKSPI